MEKFLTNIINSPEFLIFSIIIGTVFLLCLGSVVYLVCKIREHRKHYLRQKERASAIKAIGMRESFCWVLQRNYVHYYSYATQMVLNLLCNVSSILFSIGTFSTIAVASSGTHMTLIMSFLSIVIIIVSLFLKPGKRAQQYVYVWRMTNKDIMMVLMALNNGEDEDQTTINTLIKKAVSDRCEIEFSLNSDED